MKQSKIQDNNQIVEAFKFAYNVPEHVVIAGFLPDVVEDEDYTRSDIKNVSAGRGALQIKRIHGSFFINGPIEK